MSETPKQEISLKRAVAELRKLPKVPIEEGDPIEVPERAELADRRAE